MRDTRTPSEERPNRWRVNDPARHPHAWEEAPAWALPAFVLALLVIGAIYRLLT